MNLKISLRRWRQNGGNSFFDNHGNRENKDEARKENRMKHQAEVGVFLREAMRAQDEAQSSDEEPLQTPNNNPVQEALPPILSAIRKGHITRHDKAIHAINPNSHGL